MITMFMVPGCSPGLVNAYAYSVEYNDVSYTYNDLDILGEKIAEQIEIMNASHDMANAARILGYSEDHEVLKLAKKEWTAANNLRLEYQLVYDKLVADHDLHWAKKSEEYPAATEIWLYLTEELGYNNYVAAGIMGNIMAEVGGQTLNIQYWLSGNGYYGMCQWNKAYSSIWGGSLSEQCDFLRDTIEYEFDTFGNKYAKGFDYDEFLKLTDVKKAAKAFAQCYERCGSGSYKVRQKNAVTAYNYFVS